MNRLNAANFRQFEFAGVIAVKAVCGIIGSLWHHKVINFLNVIFLCGMSNIELPPTLLEALRGLIIQARQQALRSVDTIQVQTYWQIGRHIVEFEQGGQASTYGKRLLAELAAAFTGEFGKGFDERNLWNMRAFFQYFPNWNALRSELSWTHYRLLLRVDTPEARLWYMQEAAEQNWSTRVLER